MAQESAVTQETAKQTQGDEQGHGKNLLGPILCWAVVFADIGTSVYYVPGLLYGTRGITSLAGFFVFLTMSVFVLLTLKYAEVTHRFPQGGGVVTVAAQAMNHWVGALGGMFILVDYFLTAAISCLSGMEYLSVVVPALDVSVIETHTIVGPIHLSLLAITIGTLVLLGILNWVGVSESARVSLVGAIIAFISDIAILVTVFTHLSFSEFFSLFPKMFAGRTLTPSLLLIGFASSFLAFSGLESISQLSPVMKTPRKKVAGIALLLVVLTIGVTSPLLTMLSTLLLPKAAADPVLSTQLISLLGGKWGGLLLQTEVAISASALLVFASNTAIIGAYHVFLALSRMEFFPAFVLNRNRLRGTPHYSIALATGVPIVVLVLVAGRIDILGDMYAFGLLGAFSLTCLGIDIVRRRERKTAHASRRLAVEQRVNGRELGPPGHVLSGVTVAAHADRSSNGNMATGGSPSKPRVAVATSVRTRIKRLWYTLDFWLGVLTTALVMVAWSTNLVTKPLATAFGGSVAGLGMVVAYMTYARHKQTGRVRVVTTHLEGRLPDSTLAILMAGNEHNDAVVRTAITHADGHPVVFLYLGEPQASPSLRLFEVYDPYLHDQQAKETFGRAEHLAQKAKIARQFVYRKLEPETAAHVWQVIHPHDTVIAAEDAEKFENINPDRIRYELTPDGKVAHLLKRW